MKYEIVQNGIVRWSDEHHMLGTSITAFDCDFIVRIAQRLVLEGTMCEGKFVVHAKDIGGTVFDAVALNTGELLSGRLRRQRRRWWNLRYWVLRGIERGHSWLSDPEDVAESVGHPIHQHAPVPPPVQTDAVFARPPQVVRPPSVRRLDRA
ncbi:MAG: hypothetical protein WD845_09040 [Pirellulales bacterium]